MAYGKKTKKAAKKTNPPLPNLQPMHGQMMMPKKARKKRRSG